MTQVEIYTRSWCSYCRAARQLLEQLGYAYTEFDVEAEPERYREMLQRAGGRSTVPQIFIDDVGIGGYTDLAILAREGRLQAKPENHSRSR